MKASITLRGRAAAFRLDMEHLSRRVECWAGESTDRELKDMKDRMAGYRLASRELDVVADELAREGL